MTARHTSTSHATTSRWAVLPYVVAAVACWMLDHACTAFGRRRRLS